MAALPSRLIRRQGGVGRLHRVVLGCAANGLSDQQIHHGLERGAFVAPGGARRFIGGDLPLRARAPFDDEPCVLDLDAAIEFLGVLADQRQDLVQQVAERHQLALAEIDQPVGHAIALRPPAVFHDQERRIRPPALVEAAQPVHHPADA